MAGVTPGVVIQVEPVCVTREQAAAMLGMGLTTFDKYVQPELRVVRRAGAKVLIPVEELRKWAERNAERVA